MDPASAWLSQPWAAQARFPARSWPCASACVVLERLRPASQYATKPLRQFSHRNYLGRHPCGGAGCFVPLLFTLGGLVGSIDALHYIAREPNPSLKRPATAAVRACAVRSVMLHRAGPAVHRSGPLISNVRPHSQHPRQWPDDKLGTLCILRHYTFTGSRFDTQMATYRTAFGHRVLWAGFAALCSAGALLTATAAPGFSGYLSALGWAFLALAWFLQPVLLTSSLKELAAQSGQLGIGSPSLRTLLGTAGLGLVVVGFFWRIVGAA